MVHSALIRSLSVDETETRTCQVTGERCFEWYEALRYAQFLVRHPSGDTEVASIHLCSESYEHSEQPYHVRPDSDGEQEYTK